MDRRGSRFTLEILQELLDIPGDILHIDMDHRTRMVTVIFQGNGTHQVAEGMEVCIRTPQAWKDQDETAAEIATENLEEELNESWE